MSSIEGAMLLARVQRSTAPLLTTGAALRAMIGFARGQPAPPARIAAKTARRSSRV